MNKFVWLFVYGNNDDIYNFNKILSENDIDIHYNNNRLIDFMANLGKIEIVKILIDHGANINDNNGMPLVSACSMGHIEIVMLLVDSGSIISKNAAYCASKNGHFEILKYLMLKGGDIASIPNPTDACNYFYRNNEIDILEKILSVHDCSPFLKKYVNSVKAIQKLKFLKCSDVTFN